MQARKGLGVPQVMEVCFDLIYLLVALASGIWLLLNGQGRALVLVYGAMVLTLGIGDAFHLAPRILGQWTGTMVERRRALGIGKLVTSVTMTLFYVLLYYVWQLYFGVSGGAIAIWILALLRVALCLFPQNGWCEETPSLFWAILRNIPFVILGCMIAFLFENAPMPFEGMTLAITLSFAFYLAVVLFADKYKKLGMLMLPKTCMYIWIISMGFGLL